MTHPASEFPEVAAVILAAGLSSRMGRLKPLLPFAGDTVIGHVVGSLRQAGIKDIYVVVGHAADLLIPVVEALGATVVFNPMYEQGMTTSARAGIAALAPSSVASAMVLPVDIPLVRPSTFIRLANTAREVDAAVFAPTFRGQRGHPPLIGRRAFPTITTGANDASLRDHLAVWQGETVEVPVIDSGIHPDMDRPDDYRRLAAAAAFRRHPDEAECEAMLEDAGTPEPVRAHTRAVAGLAMEMAERLKAAGLPLDTALVRAGALLHDIAKGEAKHAAAGASRVEEYGFPEAATVVAGHMEMTFAPGDPIDERVVVLAADKLIAGDRRVSLAERFAPTFARFADDPNALAAVRRKQASVAAILADIEARVGPVAVPSSGEEECVRQ